MDISPFPVLCSDWFIFRGLRNEDLDASGGVVVSKLYKKSYTSESETHWVRHSYGLVPHLSKKISKLTLRNKDVFHSGLLPRCYHCSSGFIGFKEHSTQLL